MTTEAAGGAAGAGGSVGGVVGGTNADSNADLEGPSALVGGSAGEGFGVGAEAVLAKDYKGFEVNAGPTGGPVPVELHGLAATSQVTPIGNISDLFDVGYALDWWKDLFNGLLDEDPCKSK